MYIVLKEHIEISRTVYGVNPLAAVLDDGPDAKKGRRLLNELWFWLICLVCWAHQVNLITGDMLGTKHVIFEVIQQALDVIHWFNNHSAALALLNQEQLRTDDDPRAALVLITPVVTRWLAIYHTITRFLRVERAVKICHTRSYDSLINSAGREQKDKDKAEKVLYYLDKPYFWKDLRKYVCLYACMCSFGLTGSDRVQIMLEPLAIANNVTQGNRTRIDMVAVTLANLFHIYTNPALDNEIREALHKSLEKRWANADQQVFIMAVFLNPYLRMALFAPGILSFNKIYEIAAVLYKRFYNAEVTHTFRTILLDYASLRGLYGRDTMALDFYSKKAEETVRIYCHISVTYVSDQFIRVHLWIWSRYGAV